MRDVMKKTCLAIAVLISIMWILNQIFPYQHDPYKAQLEDAEEAVHKVSSAPEGYSKMNGFYSESLIERDTCATNRFPIGTKVSIWCGIDAEHGSSIEATVVSNRVRINTIDTIEFSEDINDLFAGGNMMYTVWVKEV